MSFHKTKQVGKKNTRETGKVEGGGCIQGIKMFSTHVQTKIRRRGL